jgi:predicted DNA binding CopG/RHH family protein
MRDDYDFYNSVKNPYFDKIKQQITIPVDEETLSYFKTLSAKNGIPYQNLIHLYLHDCAQQQKQLSVTWS